jgi:putative flippase GtrA
MKSEQVNRMSCLAADFVLISPHRQQLALLQFAFYLLVDGICFSVDIVGFVPLRYLDLPILGASAISFVTATIANYLLCCTLVFRSGRFSRSEEVLRLFAIALIGLPLNSAVVWLLVEILRFHPTLAKILAVLPSLELSRTPRNRVR